MTILVEDGSGFIDSESYVSVDEATQYHADRNNDAWSDGDAPSWEGALRRATEWIDATYRGRFSGYRTKLRLQALEWPRTSAYYVDAVNGPSPFYAGSPAYGQWTSIAANAIPIELRRATAEAALRELVSPGALRPDVTPGKVLKSVSISGSVSVTYADTSPQGQKLFASIISDIIAPLLDPLSSTSSMFGSSSRSS
jgi:DNA-binding transcriptional regulator YdaS (Cro superfamily)